MNHSVSRLATIRETIPLTCGVPRTSFVCPSNCGSASRTVTTAVSPSKMSSFATESSLARSTRAARSCSFTVLVSARSKPVRWVPPLGVAMTLTKERVTDS